MELTLSIPGLAHGLMKFEHRIRLGRRTEEEHSFHQSLWAGALPPSAPGGEGCPALSPLVRPGRDALPESMLVAAPSGSLGAMGNGPRLVCQGG